jgi:hypothetical protein
VLSKTEDEIVRRPHLSSGMREMQSRCAAAQLLALIFGIAIQGKDTLLTGISQWQVNLRDRFIVGLFRLSYNEYRGYSYWLLSKKVAANRHTLGMRLGYTHALGMRLGIPNSCRSETYVMTFVDISPIRYAMHISCYDIS